ncbi:MAG TPA: Asp/Glu racemase [Bacillota bacterium]|nr:Asp/Glu racemase [Bacillota bacterium]
MDDLDYGARGKIGLIVPSTTWIMEPEFNYMVPKGVIVQTTRVAIGAGTVEGYKKMVLGVKDCAKLLSSIPTDINILGCTSGSFVNGNAFDKSLCEDIYKATGVPFTTTSTSLVKALKSYDAKKICIMTPYTKDVNELAAAYFSENGIEVINDIGLGLQWDKEMNAIPLEQIYQYACKVDRPEADAVAILCTGLRTVPIIDYAERALGKPVVSAIQSSMWNVLRSIHITDPVPNAGSLMLK